MTHDLWGLERSPRERERLTGKGGTYIETERNDAEGAIIMSSSGVRTAFRRAGDPLPDPSPEDGGAQRGVANDVPPVLKGVAVTAVGLRQAAQRIRVEIRLRWEVPYCHS